MRVEVHPNSVVLDCNFRSLAFLGLLGFLIRQLKIKFIATLLSAAKLNSEIPTRLALTPTLPEDARQILVPWLPTSQRETTRGLGFRV